MDAMTGQAGIGAMRQNGDGTAQVYLQLQPGESVILRAFAERKIMEPAWVYWQPAGQPAELTGSWRVSFITGGPALPPPFETPRLASWTELDGEEAQRFAGTARYSLKFDSPGAAGRRLVAGPGQGLPERARPAQRSRPWDSPCPAVPPAGGRVEAGRQRAGSRGHQHLGQPHPRP